MRIAATALAVASKQLSSRHHDIDNGNATASAAGQRAVDGGASLAPVSTCTPGRATNNNARRLHSRRIVSYIRCRIPCGLLDKFISDGPVTGCLDKLIRVQSWRVGVFDKHARTPS